MKGFGKKERRLSKPERQMCANHNWSMTVLLAATIVALVFSLLNAKRIDEGLHKNTQTYSDQLTSVMAEAIQTEISNGVDGMKNIADSVKQFTIEDMVLQDNDALKQFLARKAAIHNFDGVVVLNRSGDNLMVRMTDDLSIDAAQLLEHKTVQESQRGIAGVGAANGYVFYAAPLYHEQHNDVLVGIMNRQKLQEIVDGRFFVGGIKSCIVDRNGTCIVAPADVVSFSYLDTLYQKGELQTVDEMLQQPEGASLYFTDSAGEENLLSCDPLGLADWRLLSIIPTNLIRGNTKEFIENTFFIILCFALLFLLLLIFIFRNNRKSRRQLYTLAYEDSITQGLNGPAFRMTYRETVSKLKVFRRSVAMLNIRNFRLINERLGFAVGDDVLRLVHECIKRGIDEGRHEFLGRSETDHFFICFDEVNHLVINKRIQNILCDIEKTVEKTNICYPLQILSGCCIAEHPSDDVQILKERARIAERDNRPEYERCLFYNGEIVSRLEREAELVFSFREAILNNEFQVYLQPKVDLLHNRPIGAEALIRWNHPVKGVISPGEFVPLFENDGKICELDLFVFETVLKLYRERIEAGKLWYPVSVNLSRYHFYDSDFFNKFIEKAQEYNVAPGAIEFELTESMYFDKEQIDTVKTITSQMHEAGFLCSIDDFGVGYSSLGMLREFDVDTLKLDRTFFLDLENPKACDIIHSIVELTAKLHMRTVAEGIETFEQMEFLRSIGCTAVQGYCFSKPLSITDFEQWVEKYETQKNK